MNFRRLWDQAKAYYAGRSRNDQRVIQGLLTLTVLSLLYVGIWVPIRDYRAQVASEIDKGQEDLERAARFLGSVDSLHAERDALKKKLDAAKKELLPGNSGTLGAAALQDLANKTATEKGVSVQSTQVMKEEPLDPFRRVAIRLTLSSELKPLAEMISELEYTHHLVLPFVEISRRGAVAAGAKGPRTLQATIEVAGFVLAAAQKEEPAGEVPAEGAPPPGEAAAPVEENAAAADGAVPAGAAPAAPAGGAALMGDAAAAAGASTSTTIAGATTTTAAAAVTTTTAAVAPTTAPSPKPGTPAKPPRPAPPAPGAK